MKFICQQQLLNEAINNVSRAVAIKSSIPVLEGIRASLKNGKLELTGYDLEIGIQTEIDVITSDSGEIVLNARLFSDIIRKMPSDSIEFDIDEDLNVTISSSSAEYKISAMSSSEYPDVPEVYKDNALIIPQAQLKNMINQTLFAVAANEGRSPVLTGELFNITGGSFDLVALDGYRLAVRTEKIKSEDDYKFVVPSKAMSEISKILSDEPDKTCSVYQAKKHIIFDISGYVVISRLLEGDFHDYKSSIPVDHTTEVVLKTRNLIQSLERCTLLISDKIKAPVRCMFGNGTVKISCSSAIGKLNDEFEIDHTGNVLEIGFNCRYLLDALKATESDKIRLLMKAENKPMKIVPMEGNAYTFLVLPVRLKQE